MIGYTPVEEDIRRNAAAHPAAELAVAADLEVTSETRPDGTVIPVFRFRFAEDAPDGPAAVEAVAKVMGTDAVCRHGVWLAIRDFGSVRIEASFTSYARIDGLLTHLRREVCDEAGRRIAAKAGAAA